MKQFILLFLLFGLRFAASAQTSYYTFNGGGTGGNWNTASTWTTDPTGSTSVGAAVPGNNDFAYVTNSYVLGLTANVASTGLTVTVQRGGTLDLATFAFSSTLTRLAGQGTLRAGQPYFPVVTNNDFDDASTGTVEFYNWATTPGTLPQPASGQYNNLRLLNTSGSAYAAQLDASLTLNGSLTLSRSTGSAAVALNLGQTAATNRTLTMQGDVIVGAGTSLGVTATAGAQAHTLNVNGSLTNNGTVRLHNGNVTLDDSQRCLLVFGGATNTSFACNGPTDLSRLQVSKGAGSNAILSVTSAVNLPNGNLRLNYLATADLLILTNGTAKLGANIVLPKLNNGGGNYDVGSSTLSPMLWIAGATVYNNTANALVAYGSFRISAGRFESLGGEGIVTREDGQFIIEGGTTVVEKFRPSNTSIAHRGSFTITGGVFECSGTGSDANYARFSHPYKTQSFRMSGGTIRVSNPQNSSALFHIGVNADNATVTGGTIELLLPNTATNCSVLSTVPLWNLTLSKPVSGGTSKAFLGTASVTPAYVAGATLTAQPLTVLNNFNINGSNPATFDANSQDVNIAGTFTIGTGCAYLPTTNTTRFNGGQDQLLTNNGSIGTTSNTFYNLTVDKSAGTLTLDGTATTFTVTNTLSLLNGVMNDGSKMVNVLGSLINSASHTSGGGTGAIVVAGTGGQTISGNGNGVFGNLTINSTTAVGTVAATLTASQSVASVLKLQSNTLLDIGTNRLSLTSISPSALVAGTGGFSNLRMIRTAGNQSDPGLRKTYGGADSFTFAVGTGSKYTPATIALTAAVALYGKVSVSPANVRNPFVTNTNSLAFYWKVRSVDFGAIGAGTVNADFRMLNTDATGTLVNYVPGRYLPVSWTSSGNVAQVVENSPLTGNSLVQFPGLSQFDGEFTAGEPASFGTVTAYYSIRNGNWEDTNPATTPWSTTSHSGAAVATTPGPGNPVFVGSASGSYFHSVTVTANAATAGALVIDRGSVLDVGTLTGHNFGALPDATASGAGRLRISSATATAQFPGGDFGSFLQSGGGTVEYYTTGSQDFTVPTTSFTSLALPSYKNLWLNAASGRTVTLPNLNLRVYAQLKTGTVPGTYTGLALLSGGTAGNLVIDSLLAVQNGTLRFANTNTRTLTVSTNLTVGAGAIFEVGSMGTAVANQITVGGSLTNDGTLDLGTPASFRAGLTFNGSANASLTGTTGAATTTLSALAVTKGLNQTPVLTLDVAGTLTTPTNSWLTLTTGTLRYAKGTGTLTIHDAASAYVINENAALTVDAAGANVTVATANDPAADLQLAGQVKVLQGSLKVGDVATGAGNDIEYASAGRPTLRVSGTGSLYVNGQVRRSTVTTTGALRYDQSGGSLEIGGFGATAAGNKERGLFEVQGTGSMYRHTGGTLTLRRSNGNAAVIADLYLRPDSTVVAGGSTVVLGNAVAGAGNVTVSVDSTVPLWDMLVEAGANATNLNTARLTGISSLTLKGSLTIGNSNSFFSANSLALNIGQQLINNNPSTSTALNAGGFQPISASQVTTFTGGIAGQQIQPSGGTTNLTVFGSLVLNNSLTGGGLTLQANRNVRVAGKLTLTRGTLADNGQTITALGEVANSATHSSATGGSLTLAGTTNQTVSGNGSGRFGNVILNNATGATATANQEITDVLTLTSGVLTIGSNLLWLSNTAAAAVTGTFSATRCIRTNGIVADLGVRKSFPAAASDFTFPLGVAAKYTPVRLNVTANTVAGTVTVRPVNTAHPSTTDPAAKELSYYWKLSSTGFNGSTAVTQVFSYVDVAAGNDVNGTEASYKLGRFLGGAWTPVNGIVSSTVSTVANTLTNAGVNYFDGDYTGGETTEFGTVPTFYSRNATAGAGGANWDSPAAWTFNADGSDAPIALPITFPTLANPVVIRAGHVINSNGPSRGAANLNLLGTLDLAANGANNFNTVTGNGTLRIGSALFPAGNYAAFVAGGTGGTVDYTAAVQLPARDTYNNLTLSGSGTAKLLSNLDLTINGALTATAGTTVDNPTSQSLTLTSATGGATLGGVFNLNDGILASSAFLTNTGTLTLGAGAVSTSTGLTNSGTLSNGSGNVTVGSTFANSGTYNANIGAGSLTVGSTFANSGAFVAGNGDLGVSGDFTNALGGTFTAATGDVVVSGNFTNAGTYTASTNDELRLTGDFTNTGTFTAGNSTLKLQSNFINNGTFAAGTSLVQFLSNSSRIISGSTTFYDIQKLGSGLLVLGYVAGTDITVSNLLSLQNGLLSTGTANTVYLTNTTMQPIVGTSTTAYLNGRLAISMPNTAAASRTFPVGLGGRYRPVVIQQAASTNPVVLIEIFNGAPGGTVDMTLSNLSANRYYRGHLLSGIINSPTVQLSFNTEGIVDEAVNVPGNLRVARSVGNGGPWTNAGGAGVFSPAAPSGYTISAPVVLDNDSYFALASTNAVDNPLTGLAPLPIELLRFTAQPQGSAVALDWATATEKHSAYFEVQRSADGRNFVALQHVEAAGTSTAPRTYTTRDTQPLSQLSYYRLRLVDQDGSAHYSPVRAVSFGKAVTPAFALYPNPNTGRAFTLLATNLNNPATTMRVTDALGRVVQQQALTFAQPTVTVELVRPLAAGLYVLTVQTATGPVSQKMVVE